MSDESVGQRIRRLRQERGLSQDRLATAAKISKSFLSEVENDASKPRGPILVKLAKALGASIDYLLTGHEPGRLQTGKVEVPASLARFAEQNELPYSHVSLLIDFFSAIEARRRESGKRELSEEEWRAFYEQVKDVFPGMDEE